MREKPAPTNLVVGLVQMSCSANPADNLARASALVRQAAQQGATVVALPELFMTPYFPCRQDPANFDLAEALDGPTARQLGTLAQEIGVVLLGSFFERRAPGVFHNTAVLFDADGTRVGVYRKMHIPDDPLYFEKYYFTPGDLGFRVFQTRVGAIGVQVCWDQWFPEGARLLALQGASIVFYPTAIGWIRGEHENAASQKVDLEAWKTVQRGHAIANGLVVAAVNRVGHEGDKASGIDFWGHSFVCDPFGVMLAEAAEQPEIVLARCEASRIEEVRRSWPFLRDRRVDAYDGIKERFLGE